MKKNYFGENERELVLHVIRAFILVLLLIIFIFTFYISYKTILFIAFNSFIIFLLFSITYFLFVENKVDRKLLEGILKTYLPSVIVLFTIVSNIDTYATSNKIDYYKTELNYYMTIGDTVKLKQIHEDYETYNNNIARIFEKEEVKNVDTNSSQKKQDNNDEYIFWYANLLINMITCLSLLMFLKCFTELSKFKIKIKKDVDTIVYKKGKFIKR